MSQRIHLDATPGLFHQVLHCHQGDVGRQFEIAVVTRDGYEIPSGATFKIQATKPSGLGFTVTGTAANNIISFTSTEDMTSEAGEIPTQLEIKSGNDVIYTSNFLLVCETNVHPSSVTDGSPEEIISEITLLVERAESAASTAGADAAAAAQARVDEMMNYLPTEVTNLKSDFTHFAESTSDFVKSKNIYDESAGISGHYIDQTTGNVEIGSTYTYWEYMDCSDFDTIIISRSLQTYVGNVALRYALYDENKNFIAGGLGTDFNPVFDSEIQRFVGSIPSQGAKYIRISYDTDQVIENRLLCVGDSELYVPYVNDNVPKRTADIPHMYEGVLGKSVLSVSADTFTSGRISLADNNIQSPNKIVFVANVTSFNRIDIAHADIYDNGDRIVIDNTNMVYIVNGTPTSPMAHSLTIKDYIKVTIEVEAHYQGKFNITIETNGGKYSRSDLWWVGYYGGIYVDCVGSSLTACKLIFSADALDSNVWIMGDSYLSYAPIRWPYYMYEDGITDFLINAYPGAGCANILPTFENLLSYGNPKYAVWCLGMNDPDSGSLNGSWQVRTGTFITECILNNIEPILATIPNTPTQDNTYKNAFVRASGLRYIDFAKAVNAESAGATWYSGMLSDDNVHPTEEGAKALYMAFVRDFPEILSA